MTTPPLNSESMRDLVVAVFKKLEDIDTFVQFAFSSKQALQAFNILNKRLLLSITKNELSFELIEGGGFHKGLSGYHLSDENMAPLYLMCNFVKKIVFFFDTYHERSKDGFRQKKSWSDEQTKCFEKIVDACRHFTALRIRHVPLKEYLLPNRSYEFARSVSWLEAPDDYLRHLSSKYTSLPLVTELHIEYSRNSDAFDYPMPSEEFVPNLTTLVLVLPQVPSLRSKMHFSKVEHLEIEAQISYQDRADCMANLKYLFSFMENMPALKTARIDIRGHSTYMSGKVLEDAFNDALFAHEGPVNIFLNMTFGYCELDVDTTGYTIQKKKNNFYILERTLFKAGKKLHHYMTFSTNPPEYLQRLHPGVVETLRTVDH